MSSDLADRLAAGPVSRVGALASARRVHICFIAVHIYPVLVEDSGIEFVGGAEVQQSVQIRALQRAGYRVSVLVKDHGQPEVVEREGLSILKIPGNNGRGWPGTRFLYPRLSDVVRLLYRVDPDLVFVQAAGEQVFSAALYARLARKRFVFAGASDPDFSRGPMPDTPFRYSFMYRLGLRAAHTVIVQNVEQQRLLSDNFGKKGQLVQNGYDEPGARPGSFSGPVLWAATVKRLKRPDLLIELARRVPERHFIMVGGPGTSADAHAYAESMAVQARSLPNLSFMGHVPYREVGRFFDGAALCVNTSDYEGFPNTFMQAWIRGIPTVSFVRPESAPGSSGTQACADLDDMVLQLRRLTGDEAAWSLASESCRRHFQEHHTMDGALQRYEAIFLNALLA